MSPTRVKKLLTVFIYVPLTFNFALLCEDLSSVSGVTLHQLIILAVPIPPAGMGWGLSLSSLENKFPTSCNRTCQCNVMYGGYLWTFTVKLSPPSTTRTKCCCANSQGRSPGVAQGWGWLQLEFMHYVHVSGYTCLLQTVFDKKADPQ